MCLKSYHCYYLSLVCVTRKKMAMLHTGAGGHTTRVCGSSLFACMLSTSSQLCSMRIVACRRGFAV